MSRYTRMTLAATVAAMLAAGFMIWVIVLYTTQMNGCPVPPGPVYPGCLPATCESRGSISTSGAYLSRDSISVLNSDGRCCLWDPRQSGPGTLLDPLTVTLHMQTTDDLVVVTNDTLLDIDVTFTGGDLAVRACLPAFSFFLNDSTPDANGQLGLGGYFWSDGTAWIPAAYSPASNNYTTLPLGGDLFAAFFNDGSVRLMGPEGVAIPAGTYDVPASCIIYNARGNGAAPPLNVLISDEGCVSSIAGVTPQTNRQTYFGNYYEYFGVDYYNGVAYIVSVENCYPASNNGTEWFNRTMLSSFYKVQRSGAGLARLAYTPTLDGSLAGDSLAVLRNQFRTNPAHLGEFNTNQQEPGITVSRIDPNNVVVGLYSGQISIPTGGFDTMFSSDGGVTWDVSSAQFTSDVGIPGALMVPYPDLFYNQTWNCSNSSGDWNCPPLDTDTDYTLGWEWDTRSGLYPQSGGDTRVATDAFDVQWRVGLYSQGVYGNGYANDVVGYSLDYGQTWKLAGDIRTANGSSFSYDYNVVAAGSDGKGGAQFCVSLKVDSTVSELIVFGTTQPVEMNCFHTSERGIVDSIDRVSMPGTKPGHYGGMAIGMDGTIYYVMQGMTAAATNSESVVIGIGAGPLGSSALANAPIMFTACTPSPGVVCAETRVIARSDYGYACPAVQAFRCTWAQPSVLVDRNNNLYVIYTGVVRNPLATPSAFTALINAQQATRILMTKSCDGGVTWSAPQVINDDAADPDDSFSTPNVHFNTAPQYDPITNTILVSWIDTRVDQVDHVGSQVYAAVITL